MDHLDEDDLLGRTRALIRERIAPMAAHHDSTGEFPSENIRLLGQMGLMGLFIPKSYGGLERDFQTFVRVVELIATACPSTAMIYVMHSCQYIMLVDHGTQRQRDFFLPPIARGESLLASATTEPETGGNADYCVSAKELDGDELVLSAKKPVVTAANHADWVLCTTRASASAPGNRLSMVVMPGLTRGKGVEAFGAWDCVGMRATASSGLEYTGCRVPAWHQIGPDDSQEVRATSMTLVSRAGFSAVWLGIAQAAFDQTLAHLTCRAHEYIIGDRRFPAAALPANLAVQTRLAEYETVQRQIAEMLTQVEASRHLLYAAAAGIDRVRPGPAQPPSLAVLSGITDLLWAARISCGETAIDVTRVCLRVCGVTGLRRGLLTLERNMRDALTSQVMAPGEDITKLMLGRKILNVPPPSRA